MTIVLSEAQRVASATLQANPRYILGDHPGVGKSFPAIDAALSLPPPRLLVVPNYLGGQWVDYIERYCRQLAVHVTGNPERRNRILQRTQGIVDWYIISYNMLAIRPSKHRGEIEKLPTYRPLLEREWNTVIFDEAHRMRGRNSQVVAHARKLKAKRMWFLTGTPLVKNAGDIWPLLNLIDPKKFSSYWRFVQEWCRVIDTPWQRKVEGIVNADQYYQMLTRYMLRRNFGDAGIPIPETVPYDIPVELPPSVMQTHRQIRDDYLGQHEDLENPILVSGAGAMITQLRYLTSFPPTKENPKLDALEQIIEEHPNEPIIVFTWYRQTRDKLREALKGQTVVTPLCFVSDDNDRNEVIKKWESLPNGILLSTMGKISEGCNLQYGRIIVFYEQDWVEASNLQSIARVARNGQTRPPLIYRIFARNTVDSTVKRAAEKKYESILKALKEDALEG